MMAKIFVTFLFLTTTLPVLFSSTADSLSFPKTLTFDGVLKTKLETSTVSGDLRFNVRNSRIGARGSIGSHMGYRLQVELSNEGVFNPLDLHGILKPVKNLSILFGQTSIPFENSYVITPAEMMFANRAFVGKYFTPGSRDIGIVAQYTFQLADLPLEGQAGVFNGGKINNPQWTQTPSYAFRLIAGSMDGLRASAKLYRYPEKLYRAADTLHDLLLWGLDVHYDNRRLRLEAEVMNNYSYETSKNRVGMYAQGSYTFDLQRKNVFQNLTPAIRWDLMKDGTSKVDFEMQRISSGISFGLSFLPYESLIRVNYEHYFLDKNKIPESFFEAYTTDHKLTVELVVRF